MLYNFIVDNDDYIENINEENINEENNEEELHECFICFEIKKGDKIPIRLKLQTNFLKFCACDGWIHNSCLKLWFIRNKECPICRKVLIENLCSGFHYSIYIFYFYFIIKSYLIKIGFYLIRFRHFIYFCSILPPILYLINSVDNYYYNEKYEKTYNTTYIDYYKNDDYFNTNNYYTESNENRIIPYTN